ncbi:MAG TPA: hypothetical protein VFA20_18075 [Myxococcaceae bacterium]|nr:hypothetical protein [Myxococcaceae bacterium]
MPVRKRQPSKSADWARDQRIAEELAMTPRERVLQALELGEWVRKELLPRVKKHGET